MLEAWRLDSCVRNLGAETPLDFYLFRPIASREEDQGRIKQALANWILHWTGVNILIRNARLGEYAKQT